MIPGTNSRGLKNFALSGTAHNSKSEDLPLRYKSNKPNAEMQIKNNKNDR